jgi:hypothetical protein
MEIKPPFRAIVPDQGRLTLQNPNTPIDGRADVAAMSLIVKVFGPADLT